MAHDDGEIVVHDPNQHLLPVLFDALLDDEVFDELVSRILDLTHDPRSTDHLRESLARHLAKAEQFISQSGTERNAAAHLDMTLQLDGNGVVIRVGDGVSGVFPLREGTRFLDLEMTIDGHNALAGLLASTGEGTCAANAMLEEDGTQHTFLFAKKLTPAGIRIMGELTANVWTDAAVDIFRSSFGLTDAECEVLGLRVCGMPVARVADERGRSVETIRSQIKSILGKTGMPGATALILMATGIARGSNLPKAGHIPPSLRPAQTIVALPDGRKLDLLEAGDLNGQPVLFLHGCICGRELPDSAYRWLKDNGWRMLIPARPSHGLSDPANDMIKQPWLYAADIAFLLDHLGVASCPIIGNDAGSVYGICVADQLKDRISQVVAVACFAPANDTEKFNYAPPQQRVFLRLAKTAHPLSKILARIAHRKLWHAGREEFPSIVFAGIDTDITACEDPELRQLIWDGHMFHVASGSDGFVNDVTTGVCNWTDSLGDIGQKVTFVHGTDSAHSHIDDIRELSLMLDAGFVPVQGAGHTVAFTHWPQVFEALQAGSAE